MTRVLFCLKYREGYFGSYSEAYGGSDLSSGLRNSVSFVVQMLNKNGIQAKMVHLADNNKIDAAIAEYRPTHCIIEAFWVVPEKFDELMPLHKDVYFSVRNHSEMAFLANEGISQEWSAGYLKRGIELQSNSPRTVTDMQTLARAWNCDPGLSTWAPNHYPLGDFNTRPREWREEGVAHIGLFGAVRPLKNHLTQAVAALSFAEHMGRRLKLHINSGRIEAYGNPILKNLRAVFANSPYADLIEHPWHEHDEFLDVLDQCDYSCQVSFSESFNIVSADATNRGLAVIASPQIPWMPRQLVTDPNSAERIYRTMLLAESYRQYNTWQWLQYCGLKDYCDESEANWIARYS